MSFDGVWLLVSAVAVCGQSISAVRGGNGRDRLPICVESGTCFV